MIHEINGWKIHPASNMAIGQYLEGASNMLAVMTWKPEGYDRLRQLNWIRKNRGTEIIGDRNALLKTDLEYGSAGFYLLVDTGGRPTTIFLSENRKKTSIEDAATKASPREVINLHIKRTRRGLE